MEFTRKLSRLMLTYVQSGSKAINDEENKKEEKNLDLELDTINELMSDEAKSQQWHLLIKPLYKLVSLLNRQSDDFAIHCITGCLGKFESPDMDPESLIP